MILTLFFLINAIFWGLYDHATHCKIAAMLGILKCPSHLVHILMGLVSFMIAIFIQQKTYLQRFF